ncbi:protein of unknown function DUF177 [Desulfurobacterium thermolithotrophum DSM 11699]|uniref:Large ribosomal RNA subunit accumulation protein YceD n=1 Tax=Desulfurobacterium thermolithotrophum (strain DSM 11699 / BSA) TaxID=868864 RepID=F0S3V3_DESTD|nr:DUF177 domain-containing protein [Desulfurobacterium thermolithotrophum]ADY73525.1 protein of unknown function DUF177 [Desulfurobacterium thermolithotrophum DSM 11699]
MKRKINLNEVTDKEPIKVDTEIQPSLLELPKEEVVSSTPFKLHIEVYKKPVGYDIYGRIEGEVELICSRCNKSFKEKMRKSFYYQLMPTSEITGGEIKAGDLDVKFADSDALDLAEVVKEQVLLNLPLKPLCDEQCQVPDVPFEEGSIEEDKRWEKLKTFKDKLKEKEK